MAVNADGPDGLTGGKAPGARPRLNADQRDVLKELVEQGPVPAAHGVVRWRLCDLAQTPAEDHGVSASGQALSRFHLILGPLDTPVASMTRRNSAEQSFAPAGTAP